MLTLLTNTKATYTVSFGETTTANNPATTSGKAGIANASATITNQRKPSTPNSTSNLSKKLKLKQPVMMSKPTMFSNVTRKIDSRNNNLDIMLASRNRTNNNHARK